MGSHASEIVERLKSYEKQIQDIMELFPKGGTRMLRHNVPMAKARLRDLKSDLNEECKRRDFSGLEERTLEPAVKQTSAYLTVRVNSSPDRRWFEQLYEARGTISWARTNLEKQIADRTKAAKQ
jgi:hypothetical protein